MSQATVPMGTVCGAIINILYILVHHCKWNSVMLFFLCLFFSILQYSNFKSLINQNLSTECYWGGIGIIKVIKLQMAQRQYIHSLWLFATHICEVEFIKLPIHFLLVSPNNNCSCILFIMLNLFCNKQKWKIFFQLNKFEKFQQEFMFETPLERTLDDVISIAWDCYAKLHISCWIRNTSMNQNIMIIV